MKQEDVKKIFADAGAIITGDHFVYAKKADGWHHGDTYVNKDAIYPDTDLVKTLCGEIAKFFSGGGDIGVVVGPTIGAVSLSQWTADLIKKEEERKDIRAVFAEEQDILEEHVLKGKKVLPSVIDFSAYGKVKVVSYKSTGYLKRINFFLKVGTERILKRGYDKIVAGRRCLVVEDIITSGETVKKTIVAIRKAGGEVLGVGALCNRSGGKVTARSLGVPVLFSLLNLSLETMPEDTCLICKEKGFESVRTDLGKGKEFLIRKGIAV